VTHVRPETSGEQGAYLAVALTAPKACSKVHLKTRLPYDELHAVLVRWDDADVPSKEWSPALERYLGPVSQFGPRRAKPCSWCEGRGHEKISDGPCNSHWRTEVCRVCKGTGVAVRGRRPR